MRGSCYTVRESLLEVSRVGDTNWPGAADDELCYRARKIKFANRRTDKLMIRRAIHLLLRSCHILLLALDSPEEKMYAFPIRQKS